MLVFLDIDGVLNQLSKTKKENIVGKLFDMDPVCVNNLNTLLDSLDGEIVITSTWRVRGLDLIKERLKNAGLKSKYLNSIRMTPLDYHRKRDKEIKQFLKGRIEPIIILDDESIEGFEFTRIKWETGLTLEVVNRLVKENR